MANPKPAAVESGAAVDLRRDGHNAIDWIAQYLENVERFPVLAQVKPGEILARLPPNAPAMGETFDQIFAPLRNEVEESGITDQELDDLLKQARDEAWGERKAKQGPGS